MVTRTHKVAWNNFVAAVQTFEGNQRAEYNVDLVESMVKSYVKMGYRISSFKIHIIFYKFKKIMSTYLEEQDERFHQGILDFERRYQETYNGNLWADYIWGPIRESNLLYKYFAISLV